LRLGLDVGRSHPQLLGQAGKLVVAHVTEVVDQLAERAGRVLGWMTGGFGNSRKE